MNLFFKTEKLKVAYEFWKLCIQNKLPKSQVYVFFRYITKLLYYKSQCGLKVHDN